MRPFFFGIAQGISDLISELHTLVIPNEVRDLQFDGVDDSSHSIYFLTGPSNSQKEERYPSRLGRGCGSFGEDVADAADFSAHGF